MDFSGYSQRLRMALGGMLAIALALLASAWVLAANGDAVRDDEGAFLAENAAAMSKMMTAMAIEPAGNVDTDFVAAMVPHHQGAIEMAQAQLRHGHNARLRRIAQEIIVTQTQEIAAMQLAIKEESRK